MDGTAVLYYFDSDFYQLFGFCLAKTGLGTCADAFCYDRNFLPLPAPSKTRLLLRSVLFCSRSPLGWFAGTPSSSPLETPWYKSFAMAVITVFQYLILLAIMIFIFNVFGLLFFLLFVITVVRYKQTHTYSLALEILSSIGMSMRQSLPLPMALTSAAHGQKQKEAKIFPQALPIGFPRGIRCRNRLARGYRKCPPELLAAIAAAEKMDQLPKAIETLELDIEEKVNDYKRTRPHSSVVSDGRRICCLDTCDGTCFSLLCPPLPQCFPI